MERVRAVRTALSDDIELAVEFHGNLTLELAVRLAEEISEFDPLWIEEPVSPENHDALAVTKPIWMVGDSADDTLEWHDHLLTAGVVPVAPYNPRNTDKPLDIEDRIEEHNEDVQLKQLSLAKRTTAGRRLNEPTMRSRTAASGTSAPEAASTHEHKFSLRYACGSSITNYEREDNPGSTVITM